MKVIVPGVGARYWQRVVVDRLRSAGHEVCVAVEQVPGKHERFLDAILSIEGKFVGSKRSLVAMDKGLASEPTDQPCELVIDFLGRYTDSGGAVPTLTTLFEGRPDFSAAVAVLCRGDLPVIDLHLDGVPVAHGAPMSTSRVIITRGLNDILARAITLIVRFVNRDFVPLDQPPATAPSRTATFHDRRPVRFGYSYFFSNLPRLARRAVQRRRFYPGHWRVGYRFIDGEGVLETGSLAGPPWTVLPDPGDRFYADPFPFEWQGRHFLFVEELVHAVGKGVISVSECGPDGVFGRPRRVLEEPYHLSYPQVFSRDGEIWMIPESSGGNRTTLYRAEPFPDRWVEHRVLIADREIFDATLLDYNGLLWLFGTDRDGVGSASDTMVVFFADSLDGPWRPHSMNPVLIDKSAARPGGGFTMVGDNVVVPIQDGAEHYGGGLGLSKLIHLDTERVELSRPVPVKSGGNWPYRYFHTLNRHGRLETIDGFDDSVRRK